MIPRIVIDSTAVTSELCSLGRAAGTDKSPYNTVAHRHPYTAVYSMLFAPLKNRALRFAEIGVAGGASAMMWDNYFTNPAADLRMFDSDLNFLANGRGLVGSRFTFAQMDVAKDGDVGRALAVGDYDVIIDDSSHNFEHQIRIIKEAWPHIKSGGMLIVEDIFRSRPDEDYAKEIFAAEILEECSAAYFVMCEHAARWSPGWDNDKLLVLVKA
jgi:predicted O-methyltransferase YrrM